MTGPGASHGNLREIYDRRFGELAAYRRGTWDVLVREFFVRYIPRDAAVLDLGCGWGEFINRVPAAKKYAMDLNPDSPPHLAADVEFFAQDCSQRWPLADGVLDTVFTSNFFEHLPDKAALERALREALRCLKPGGKLICLGPNIKYLAGPYWDFWDHYLPLSELSLKEGMEMCGYRVETCLPRFLPYTMSRGTRPPLALLRLYLKLPIVWPLVGKQFLVIGVKP